MPLRKVLIIRKYIFLVLGILLTCFWLNQNNVSNEQDFGLKQFPSEPKRTTLAMLKTRFLQRKAHLLNLIQKDKLKVVEQNGHISLELEKAEDDKLADDLIANSDIEATTYKYDSEAKPSRYFVKSKKCMMPYADPFSRDVLEFYHPAKFKECTKESNLFRLSYDQNSKHYQLHVNEQLLPKLKPKIEHVKCNYRAVTRGTDDEPDRNSDIHPPIYFQKLCTLPRNLSAIIVECHAQHDASLIVQQDAFSLVQVGDGVERIESYPPDRKPSVIILGLDSMSRMNFHRTMPKTAEFVKKPGWYEMEGYNKMADNTVPNMMPVLLGQKASKASLDRLPWIWKDYANAGYITSMGEDILNEGLFVMDLSGFEQQPVHHYLRTLMVGIVRALNTYKRFGYDYCIGRRLTVAYVYDFCVQLTKRFVEELDQPIFAFFWSCTFTHDFYFGASSLDAKFLEYLVKLERHKLFENAIVILMSDHGARHGDLADLPDSFLEERLPMLHIYLPPWFRDTYPEYADAMHLNRNRLCSNFDVHNTLRHILRLNATTAEQLPALATCTSSQSLLHPLPEERSCENACIGEHWCTCNEYIKEPLGGEMYMMGKQVIFHINRWMIVNKFNKYCQRILLQDMEKAERKMLFEKDGKESMYGTIVTYRLRFRTNPAGGKFQVTLRYDRKLEKIESLFVPDISRLNSYRNHSQCVENKIAKKFCFCYPKGYLDSAMAHWKTMKITTPNNK